MATAPITDDETRNDYTATSGQTEFTYTFWIRDAGDLDVYQQGVLLTLTTDYTVSAVQSVTGANIVLTSGATLSDAIAIVLKPAIVRQTEFQTSGTFKATTLNLELTYMISLLQYLDTQLFRTLHWADSVDTTNFSDFELVDPTGFAGNALVVNAAEDGIEYSVIADTTLVGNFETLVTDGNNSDTVFALGFTPASVNSIIVEVDDTMLEPTAGYTVSGTDITFISTPSSGTNNIVVKNLASGTTASVPADSSVSTAKLQDLSVTNAKLAGSITAAKITTGTSGANIPLLNGANTHSGVNTFTKTLVGKKGADVTSADPLVLGTDGNYFDVTGTVDFATINVAAGTFFTIQFDGILEMTHNGTTLDLLGEVDLTTAAGDVMSCFATGTNTVQVLNYTRATGKSVTAGPFTEFFESTAQTMTAAGGLTIAHGLSGRPKGITVEVENVTSEGGYTTGERIVVVSGPNGGTNIQTGAQVQIDATNLTIRFGSSDVGRILNKATGASQILTASKWKLIVSAWF